MSVNGIHRQLCSLINITYSLRLERCHKAFKVVRGQSVFTSNLDDGEGHSFICMQRESAMRSQLMPSTPGRTFLEEGTTIGGHQELLFHHTLHPVHYLPDQFAYNEPNYRFFCMAKFGERSVRAHRCRRSTYGWEMSKSSLDI